jgi:hypothetical protein
MDVESKILKGLSTCNPLGFEAKHIRCVPLIS